MHNTAGETEIIRSRFNRGVSVVVWVVCAAMFASAVAGGAEAVLRSSPAIALFAFGAWLVLWRPYLLISDDALVLRNVAVTVTVPWAALVHVDTKYALTLVTPHRRVVAWVAPAAGALTTQRIGRSARKRSRGAEASAVNPFGATEAGSLPGELAGTESGDAARRLRAHWQQLLDAGAVPIGEADTNALSTSWHVVPLVVLAVLALLSLLGALL